LDAVEDRDGKMFRGSEKGEKGQRHQTYHNVLGIEPYATQQQPKKAYH